MMGDADAAVLTEQSLELAEAFATDSATPASGPSQTAAVCLSRWHQRKIWRHDGGHRVPQRAADISAILNFLLEVQRRCITSNGGASSAARTSSAPGASEAAFTPLPSSAGAAGAATRITEAQITMATLGLAIAAPFCPPAGLPPAAAAATSPPPPPACAAAGLQPPPPVQAQSSTAQTASSVPGGFRAPEEQLEELEALEAIFGEEYERLSGTTPSGAAITPLAVRIKLREPGAGDDGTEEGGGEGGGEGCPPSRNFSLVFTLPEVGTPCPPPQARPALL